LSHTVTVVVTVVSWAVTVVVTVRNEDGVRSGLNMRLDVRVKAEYERAIRETFGVIRPYAGVELERELAALVGDGRLADRDRLRPGEVQRPAGHRSPRGRRSAGAAVPAGVGPTQ